MFFMRQPRFQCGGTPRHGVGRQDGDPSNSDSQGPREGVKFRKIITVSFQNHFVRLINLIWPDENPGLVTSDESSQSQSDFSLTPISCQCNAIASAVLARVTESNGSSPQGPQDPW